ncbi:hypothetical protein Gorai_008765, partial [Gossypium raimondii]|nr:hypothetical protein [Gossypium raimondii]
MVGTNPSGFNSGVVRATKKVRSRTELPPDTDDPTNTLLEEFVLMDGDVTPVVVEGVPSITAIVQTIGPVVKLDVHTGYVRKGHFARLIVCVDLRRQLISKVRVNGCLQRVDVAGERCSKFQSGCGEYRVSKECGGWTICPLDGCRMADEKRSVHRRVKNDGQNNVNGGSRFPAFGEVEGDEQDSVNDLIDEEKVEGRMEKNKVMGFVGDLRIQGTKNQTKENRMRQQVKGKGLLIGIGPKAISKALRPNNGKMGPINVSLNLNQEKHKAVRLMEKQKFDLVIGMENKIFNFELRTVMNGLVREFERVPKKAPIEDDTSFIKEVMVIEDACNDEVN